ncbi:hypothetical protein OGY14_21765 [Citrobacter sp. Cpo073]|jgi:hypothetical protein|uniref:hypothetical protein n=1 Tax=Citrobacter TaxID=544 RepID=UPI0022E41647|nr:MULTISPECIES: hypothetical protein [Citrobacter]MDM2817946.1 hypothetical protein [Citrobacter sp. Cpo102]MDM2864780.1 hypothetical protein [Citrobacter sp. Cpo073]
MNVDARIDQFAKKMKAQGRKLSVMNHSIVAISPTEGLSVSDILEMQSLNKKGRLAAFVLAQHDKSP